VVLEAAVLSTCNRFEVYYAASDAREAMAYVTKFLAGRSGLPVSVLRRNLFMLSGDDAVWHIMRVSGGLDSLVVGECQILSQVRQCYMHSVEKDGSGGKVLSRLLNNAVAAGKRVRSETAISKGSVSVSSAAVELTTSSSNYILDEASLDLNGLAGGNPLMLVDISVPRNIAEDCKNVPNVAAYNVDDLKAVVARNTAMRQREILLAEDLREETNSFIGWKQELNKCTRKLKNANYNLSEKEIEAVERLSRAIVSKLLHGPMSHLNKSESVEGKQATVKELNAMFKFL